MDLFIVKERLKQALWLVGPCVLGIAGLAGYRWQEADAASEASAYLLPTLVAGALLVAWVVMLVAYLASLKILNREGPPPKRRFENIPWWTLKCIFLIVTIAVMAVVVTRLSALAVNEFTLLEKGRLEQLVERIATDPTVLEHKDKDSGKTLLATALDAGNVPAVELLMSYDARLEEGTEALRLVQAMNNPPMLEVLLRHGVDPDSEDPDGLAPIHYAVDTGNRQAFDALMEYGADIHVRDTLYQTPLMLAVLGDHLQLAELLLEAGADFDQWDKRGDTALHKAVQRRNDKTIRFLLGKGADPKAFNFASMAPIHIAAANGQTDLVEIFLVDPEMVYLRNDDDLTPFDHAMRGHRYETARLLLLHGAEIDRVMDNGYTVIHIMTLAEDYPAVEFLIREGADVHVAGADGETVYDIMFNLELQSLIDLVDMRDNPEAFTNALDTVESL